MTTKKTIIIVLSIMIMLASTFIYYVMPFSPVDKPIVVAHALSQNGQELLVTQKFTGTTEPYDVSLYVRLEDGHWYWYYLAHEALYWRGNIKIDSNAQMAIIYNGNKEIARYSLQNGSLSFSDGSRFVQGPQAILDGDPLDENATLKHKMIEENKT